MNPETLIDCYYCNAQNWPDDKYCHYCKNEIWDKEKIAQMKSLDQYNAKEWETFLKEKDRTTYYETIDGLKFKCKFAKYCLCESCKKERTKINDLMINQGIQFVYFPFIMECPFKSGWMENNKDQVLELKNSEHGMTDMLESLMSDLNQSELR